MSRFFVEENAVMDGEIHILDQNDIKHITKVLRMGEGDFLDISDSLEFEYRAEIISLDKDGILCRIHDKQHFAREPSLKVTLYQGIPKQGKMETIIQKCVELGVFKIVPVFMARTVVMDKGGKIQSKVQRWQKISDEAVKQCQRGIKPEIGEAISFKEMIDLLIEQRLKEDLILFPYENERNVSIKNVLRKFLNGKHKHVSIIIGPEGGFSNEEAANIKNAGAECVTLGKTILRTETAGMTALAMVMYELEL